MTKNNFGFPLRRLRRNRLKKFSRDLNSENFLNVKNLILPLFVSSDDISGTEVNSMPDIKRHSIQSLLKEANEAFKLGIPSIALFPYINPDSKDEKGSLALSKNNIINKCVIQLKRSIPDLGVICDVALDPYTNHGQDGLIIDGKVDNDETIKILCEQSLILADSGCDVLAPSDMMDGRIKSIREVMEKNNFNNIQIMSYAAKYASNFYGPFREILGSSKSNSNNLKQTYQLSSANSDEAIREINFDIDEGADMITVKPALSYLDIIYRARNETNIPVYGFQVSGEYSMIKSAAEKGWLDEDKAAYESLISIKRSGAYGMFTYFAKKIALMLNNFEI